MRVVQVQHHVKGHNAHFLETNRLQVFAHGNVEYIDTVNSIQVITSTRRKRVDFQDEVSERNGNHNNRSWLLVILAVTKALS